MSFFKYFAFYNHFKTQFHYCHWNEIFYLISIHYSHIKVNNVPFIGLENHFYIRDYVYIQVKKTHWLQRMLEKNTYTNILLVFIFSFEDWTQCWGAWCLVLKKEEAILPWQLPIFSLKKLSRSTYFARIKDILCFI